MFNTISNILFLICYIIITICVVLCATMIYKTTAHNQSEETGVEIPDQIDFTPPTSSELEEYEQYVQKLQEDSPYRRELPEYEQIRFDDMFINQTGVEVITDEDERLMKAKRGV